MSLQELLAQREELAKQKAALDKSIAEAQSQTRKDALAQIKALMAENGLTVADLAETKKAAKSIDGKRGPNAGGKVAAKYRDDAGNSWSGRGLKPKWLTAALAAGRALEEFAVGPG